MSHLIDTGPPDLDRPSVLTRIRAGGLSRPVGIAGARGEGLHLGVADVSDEPKPAATGDLPAKLT